LTILFAGNGGVAASHQWGLNRKSIAFPHTGGSAEKHSSSADRPSEPENERLPRTEQNSSTRRSQLPKLKFFVSNLDTYFLTALEVLDLAFVFLRCLAGLERA
jgi:hypothetical protein